MAKRLKASQRRTQILEAAARTFAEHGYEGTRMDDVAKEAAVAKGLIYKHFPSKDALFAALLDRQGELFARVLNNVLSEAPDGASPEVLLERGLTLWVDQAASDRPGFNFVHAGKHDPYDALRHRMRDEIVAAFLAYTPGADPEPARLLAAAVQGAAEALVMEWSERPGSLGREEAVSLLTRFCWEGLQGVQGLEALAAETPSESTA